MSQPRVGYKVSLRPVESTGLRGGGGTLWTPSKERAEQLVHELPSHRSFEEVPWDQIPEGIRAKFDRTAPPASL